MSQYNNIVKMLNLKEENIYFDDNFYSEQLK